MDRHYSCSEDPLQPPLCFFSGTQWRTLL